MTAGSPTLLDLVLVPGGLRPLYQPIFDIRGPEPVFCGVECLTRGPLGTNLEAADLLFSYARHRRAEARVDGAAIAAALAGLPRGGSFPLHLNVNASTLSRGAGLGEVLVAKCAAVGVPNERVIIEVVEQTEILDREAYQLSLADLRRRGFTIALDDVGLGTSNFLMIYLTRPDVLKADRFFVDGVSDDPVRRAVVVAIQQLAEGLGSRVVAEGVERVEDLAALRAIGIDEAQGYLLCRPLTAAQLEDFIAAGAPPGYVATAPSGLQALAS